MIIALIIIQINNKLKNIYFIIIGVLFQTQILIKNVIFNNSIHLLFFNKKFYFIFLIKFNKAQKICWRKVFSRGQGKIKHSCRKDFEENMELCYPLCAKNFTGIGEACWANCPLDFKDLKAFCNKPDSYNRGNGYSLWNKEKCEMENDGNCEQWGLMFFPKCREGYHNIGCCLCTPNCPPGMSDLGVACAKNSYSRGRGEPLICNSNEDSFEDYCFEKCDANMVAIGPACISDCPENYTDCGWFCSLDKECHTDFIIFDEEFYKVIKNSSLMQDKGSLIDISNIITISSNSSLCEI